MIDNTLFGEDFSYKKKPPTEFVEESLAYLKKARGLLEEMEHGVTTGLFERFKTANSVFQSLADEDEVKVRIADERLKALEQSLRYLTNDERWERDPPSTPK